MDLCEPKAVAAKYSSLTDDKREWVVIGNGGVVSKHRFKLCQSTSCEWVLSAVLMSQWLEEYKRCKRYQRNELVDDIEWSSYPTNEELMTVWDFDEDDAENLYNLSQDEEKCNRSLNNRLEKLKYEGRYIDPEEVLFDETRYSKSNEEAKSEIEVNQSDEGDWTGTKCNIDDDKEREQILELLKQCRKKNEERRQMFKKTKTEK